MILNPYSIKSTLIRPDETPSFRWEDEKLINYYKKKTREICAFLIAKEKNTQKSLGQLAVPKNKTSLDKINNSKKNYRPNLSKSVTSDKLPQKLRISHSALPNSNSTNKVVKPKEEESSVLHMLFPYVNEDDFKMEPFKTGADVINEIKNKKNISIIKLNQEKKIKSNFNKKFKKYDKELNTYANTPSIRTSSAYAGEDEIKRREFIESKKYWITKEDFNRFGKVNLLDKDRNKKIEGMEEDIYVEPSSKYIYRKLDKKKWVCDKNFVV